VSWGGEKEVVAVVVGGRENELLMWLMINSNSAPWRIMFDLTALEHN